MRVHTEDWRTAPPDRLAPLYAAEIARWKSVLEWDAASMCGEVECGRRLGTVQGVLLSDEGGPIVGWAYYLLHRGALQVGGIVASSEWVTERILDLICTSEEAKRAASVTVFVFTDAPGLVPALKRRGLSVERYEYLARPLPWAGPARPRDLHAWRDADFRPAVELLARVYGAPDEARPFAPRGSACEWTEYLAQITSTDGCGELLADSSVVAIGEGEALAGLALASRVGTGTGHLVQLGVDPDAEGRGLGWSLLGAACEGAHRAGCERMTLLVGADNARARRLYARAGFNQVATFVAAGSFQPRRLIKFAAGGGVSALR